ncbi:MAG: dTDP-4-dehydro-6-deoxyglucose aminotransferase [Verrucomicrobiales bacterium]|nr:dTDP-4-dehydro-6-deoxyglucose aminotransferase [Verrucomicrobiales bacterium]
MKHVTDLAIFGGTPAFTEKLHVGRPNIGNREKLLERINDMLDRRWLTNNGPFVQELERKIEARLGVKHCVLMCNGTIALEILARAVGLKGEVIVPSFTFVATPHSLQWQEITPVFCDIDPATHTLDPRRVEELITPRTTGILAVHLWSRPCDIDALTAIAKKRNLKLIFDASHAFDCSYGSRMIGNFGDAEVFSFHGTKFFNTLEGGAVTTNDDALAKKLRLMKNFGFAGYDDVIYIGTNGKMNEMCAAMGLVGLDDLSHFITTNQRNYESYQRYLRGLPGVSLLPYSEVNRSNYQYVVLEIDESLSGIHRDYLLELLHAENVIARRYFYPGCHRMEPYRSYFPHAGLLLPETDKMAQRVLVLPTGTAVSDEHIKAICNVLRQGIENAAAIKERWSTRNQAALQRHAEPPAIPAAR